MLRLQADELYKICSVLGTPTNEDWADGLKQGSHIGYRCAGRLGALPERVVRSLIPRSQRCTILLGGRKLWTDLVRFHGFGSSSHNVQVYPFMASLH